MRQSLFGVVLVFLLSTALLVGCAAAPVAPSATSAPTSPAMPTASPTRLDPTAAPSPAPATARPADSGLSLAALQNAEYSSDVVPGRKVTLSNGVYDAAAAPGSATKISVKLLDQWVARGDLNGDGVADAAVILVESGGGTGSFYRLAAVRDAAGRPSEAAAVVLGDRVKINALTIQAGEIVVDLITHGPQDPACCPTLAARQTYRLQGDRLVQANPTSTGAATAGPATKPPAAVTATSGTAGATFSDPFAYCAAAGTVDAPDARWAGPKVPPAVAAGLMAALKLPAGTPPPPIAQNSFWRCMNGKVYACTVGANLPCGEKGNADRTPSQAMKDFCQANPGSDFVPMVVTGRATLFSWKCKDGAAVVNQQVTAVDARGFLANVWYEIKP